MKQTPAEYSLGTFANIQTALASSHMSIFQKLEKNLETSQTKIITNIANHFLQNNNRLFVKRLTC